MWSAVRAAGQRTYYVNNETKETVWEKPVELFTAKDHALAATAWREYVTDDGKVYWYNDNTKESTWNYPLKLEDQTPEQEFEKACVDAGLLDGTFQAALPLLIKYDFYFKLSIQDRINLFKKLQERHLDGGGDASSRIDTSAETLPIDPLDYRRQIWKESNPPPIFLGNKPFLDELRSGVDKHHQVEMSKLRNEYDKCQKRAAIARVTFLNKLEKLGVNDKTDWLDVVNELEHEVVALTPCPGSTPVDLFFWYQLNYLKSDEAEQKESTRLKNQGLDALSKHNKSIAHVSQAEFAELTGVESSEIFEELKEGYYRLKRKRSRGREESRQLEGDQDAPKRKEVTLEY